MYSISDTFGVGGRTSAPRPTRSDTDYQLINKIRMNSIIEESLEITTKSTFNTSLLPLLGGGRASLKHLPFKLFAEKFNIIISEGQGLET